MTICSNVIPLTDSEQLAGFFGNWQGQCDQVSSGCFRGRLQVVRGTAVRVASVEFNQRVTLRGWDSSGLVAIHPVLDGRSTNTWRGHLLRPGQIVVARSDHEINHCSPMRTLDWGVHLPADMLRDAVRTLHTTDDVMLTRSWEVCSARPQAIARLMLQLQSLLDLGLIDSASPESSEGHMLEQDCVRAIIDILIGPAEPPERLAVRQRSQLVSRAEEFLRTRLSDPMGMIDLCTAIGANDRTLRLAFREHFGVGPMTYFRILRLNAVRSRLRKDASLSIADAARAYGFHHLGNFASDYRRLFGERPSATVRS